MMPPRTALLWLSLSMPLSAACADAGSDADDTPVSESVLDPDVKAELRQRALARFEALAAPELPEDRTLFDLGRRLFFERRVSADGQVACATCHLRELAGADGLALSVGVEGRKNPRNAPTVFNAVLQSSQHWRGDRSSLADQAARAPLGMASFGNQTEAEAIARLRDAGYEPLFAAAKLTLSLADFGAAIAAFEQTLITPSRFDAFLQGDNDALDSRALNGLSLFFEVGCASCHTGAGLGGRQLAKFGLHVPYEVATGSAAVDRGRFDVTQEEDDRYVFKVPMLRNVAETAPYFHDGNVIGLEQAVRVMLEVQLDAGLRDYEVENLVAFLRSLSGPAPEWFSPPE
jgi:cytochrome c peroxidase